MTSVALAPTWKLALVRLPSSRLTPLNLAPSATREISATSCVASAFRLARSAFEIEPLADCTASSRMRCRLSPILLIAPSAVWNIEMPSFALRIATLEPRTCAFMRSAMARPAASSLAELTRRPDDRRCIEVASALCEVDRLRCALSETIFVLMVMDMAKAPDSYR